MPIKLLFSSTYRRLVAEREQFQKGLSDARSELQAQTSERDELEQKLAELQESYRLQTEEIDELVEKRADERIAEMNISRRRFEQLAEDRAELIELYIQRLYAQACWFAQRSADDQGHRGLFILLIDRRNMDPQNFSDFNEAQEEFLHEEQFEGIERLPHIFSPVSSDVLNWMGDKDIRLGKEGEIVGFEERDGAILVDLTGVMSHTRQMVEGVRTHKVYSKVERLMRGSARHNAAIYASSLDEALVAIVVSEETNRVTLFRDGKFIQSYDPYEDKVVSREEYFGEPGGDAPYDTAPAPRDEPSEADQPSEPA